MGGVRAISLKGGYNDFCALVLLITMGRLLKIAQNFACFVISEHKRFFLYSFGSMRTKSVKYFDSSQSGSQVRM